MRKKSTVKTCFHESMQIVFILDKKPEKLYESRDGLIIWDIVCIKVDYWDKKYQEDKTPVYLALTNYGLKICLNIPEELKKKCFKVRRTNESPDGSDRGKPTDDNYAITIIHWFQHGDYATCMKKLPVPIEQEPLTIWLDKKGKIINRYRVIDFEYNKFIDKCEDYISDMKVKDIEQLVGDLGNVSAVCLLNKITNFLKRKFIKRSKTNE